MFNPKEHLVKITRTNKVTGEKVVNDYLEAKWRLVWAKEEHPDWRILPKVDLYPFESLPESALATVEIWEGDKVLAREFGYCEKKDFPRFVEKAITTAIGRTLALLGYGTQWAMEYEEEQVVEGTSDSPVLETVEMEEPKGSNPPTEKQINLIHSLVKGLGMSDEEYRNLLRTDFKVDSSRDLRGKQVQELIDFLKEQSRILKEQK